MIVKILFLYIINIIFLFQNSIADINSSSTTVTDIFTTSEESIESSSTFITSTVPTSEFYETKATDLTDITNFSTINTTNIINFTNSTVNQNETGILSTTTLFNSQSTTFQPVDTTISTTSTRFSFISSTVQNNSPRVAIILVIFGSIGILTVLGFLFYVWRKTKLEENKYITLAERLNTQSSRPSSPNINNMNEDLFVNNETVFSNPAFNLQERSVKDDNFKFDFDDIITKKNNSESNL